MTGRLMMDMPTTGPAVLVDPETGGELASTALPAFVLSTEGEAGDGHILRQHWDLSRSADSGGVGIPILWSHNARGELLGQWTQIGVRDLGGKKLCGRANIDIGTDDGAEAMGQIRRGFLRAVSVGWIPGATVRRGALDPGDVDYREPVDDECGMPEEGMVMGTPEQPNRLLEGSLCAVPSDPAAYVTERLHAAAERALAGLARPSGARASLPTDIDALLLLLRDHPGVRALVVREIQSIIRAERSEPTAEVRTIESLFTVRS